jgi:hypothetical protein
LAREQAFLRVLQFSIKVPQTFSFLTLILAKEQEGEASQHTNKALSDVMEHWTISGSFLILQRVN